QLRGLVQAEHALLEHDDEPAGDNLRQGVAEAARGGLPGDHEAVDGPGDALDAFPRPAAQLLVRVLEAGTVRRLLRIRRKGAGADPLRRRALLAGLPGLHGRRRVGGRPRGERDPSRVTLLTRVASGCP